MVTARRVGCTQPLSAEKSRAGGWTAMTAMEIQRVRKQSVPSRARCQFCSFPYCGTSQAHLSISSLAMQTCLRAEQNSCFLLSYLFIKKSLKCLAPLVSFVEMAEGHGKGRSKGSVLAAQVGTSASALHWNEPLCLLKGCAIGHESM